MCDYWPIGSLLCSWMSHLTSSSPPSPPGGSPPSCDSLSREVWQVANMTSCVQVHVANCMVLLLSFIFSLVDILSEVIIYFMYKLYSINNGLSFSLIQKIVTNANQIKSNHAFIIIYKGNMRGYF